MVFIRMPTWKTAISPSAKHRFDQNGNFTPLQKMMLSRNRIWGNVVGGNERSGYKELKRPLRGPSAALRYQYAKYDQLNPFVRDWGVTNKKKEKYQERKLRIFMRGMKIGQQKGKGMIMDQMSLFEMAGKKADTGQKLGEALADDKDLGL